MFELFHEQLDGPDSLALIAELNALLLELYPPQDTFFGLPEADVFIVARDPDDIAIGCGALRRLDESTAEIKRMFVRQSGRRQGIARALLGQFEIDAAALGYSRVVLETGNRQEAASALYRSCGYSEIPLFGPYVTSGSSICFEKLLRAAE